jgi:hypothetical protein
VKLLDTPRKPAFGTHIDDPRLIAELRKRTTERKVTQKKCLEDILWAALFPGEPRPFNVKPSRMQKVCPICGSHNITEPVNGFPLTCECFCCKNTFEQPMWVIA